MEYKKFETLLINVIARDVIDYTTVVRYMDENNDIKKLEILNVDYDILPNQKLLVSKVGDIVLAYYKNKKDTLNYTSFLKNDIHFHKKKPQNSFFIISDDNDKKDLRKSNLKSRIPAFIAFLALSLFTFFIFISSDFSLIYLFIIPFFLILLSGFLFFVDEFANDNTINRKYAAIYDKFILDFEQSLVDNKHKF